MSLSLLQPLRASRVTRPPVIPLACGPRCPVPCRSIRSTRPCSIPERFSSSRVRATVLRRWRAVPTGHNIRRARRCWTCPANKITTMPTSWDMFCNGMSIMQDGRVLINGGTKGYGSLEVVGVQGEVPFTGLPNASMFDPGTESFVDVTPTAHGRWYPTITELNDGRMMTTSRTERQRRQLQQHQRNLGRCRNGAPKFRAILISRISRHSDSRCIRECTCSRPVTFFIPRLRRQLSTSTLPTRPGRWWRGQFIPGQRSEWRANLRHIRTAAAHAAK